MSSENTARKLKLGPDSDYGNTLPTIEEARGGATPAAVAARAWAP